MVHSAGAAAAALVAALQHAGEGTSAVGQLLQPAAHCSLSFGVGGGAILCTGNLLLPTPAASQLLPSASSLAGVCIEQRKTRLVRPGSQSPYSRGHDIRAIVEESGCHGAVVCLPLLLLSPRSSGVPTCVGALTVGYQAVADISAPVLKNALLLAQALAQEQCRALRDFCRLLASVLHPPVASSLPSPRISPVAEGAAGLAGTGQDARSSDGLSDSEDLEDDGDGGLFGSGDGTDLGQQSSDESGASDDSDLDFGPGGWGHPHSTASGGSQGDEEEVGAGAGWAVRQAGPNAGSPRQLAGAGDEGLWQAQAHPVLLQFFNSSCEQQFAAYHAQHLQKVDAVAYLICFAFFCLEAFLPGAPFQLPRHVGRWNFVAYLGLLPGLLLACRHTRPWFTARRDCMLFLTWCCITCWVLAVKVYMQAGCITGWLAVLGLAFQMRFRFQALLVLSVNAHLLPAICPRQFIHGVLLPLACCYLFEAHTRCLFLQAGRDSGRRGWLGPGAGGPGATSRLG